MKRKLFYVLFISSLGFTSCSDEKNESVESSMEDEVLEQIESTEDKSEEHEMINNLIVSIPSPLETSFIIKESGAAYNSDFLNPIENVETYTNEEKKALNMGVYGTDLGYINIYEKHLHTVSYVTCLKTLAEDLNVGHFFDMESIERMSSASDNMDSLLIESTKSYNEMDNFLREQNRSNLSVLMAIGAWAEGMHILAQVYQQTKQEDLKSKIAEQGIILDIISQLINFNKDDEEIKKLTPYINKIIDSYKNVEITEVEGETKTIEVDGELQVIETGYTEYNISDDNLSHILEQINELRNVIIS